MIEGTGIRYSLGPKRSFFGDSRRLAFFAAFGISALAIGYIAVQDKNALTRWELFPEEKLDLWTEIPVAENFAPTNTQTKPRRKRIVLDESGMVVSSANIPVSPAASPDSLQPASKSRYVIRFAVCLLRHSAESVKKELGAKGVESVIQLGKRKMPFYRLKIGPFPDSIARRRAREILEEMSISVEPSSSAGGLITATVWLESRVKKAKKRLDAISVGSKISTGRKTRAVFRVISPRFDNRATAVHQLEEWRKKKINAVVEKVTP